MTVTRDLGAPQDNNIKQYSGLHVENNKKGGKQTTGEKGFFIVIVGRLG